MFDRTDRHHVAWDIETTGFDASDEITVAGFWFPGGHAELVANTGGEPVDGRRCEAALSDASGVAVAVSAVDDERALLEELRRIVFERFDREYNRLVAYNADAWNGGFDLPFLRTRCAAAGIDWVLEGLEFADLWEPVKKRLNTTHTHDGSQLDVNSLTGAYAILFDTDSGAPIDPASDSDAPLYREAPYDPFDSSGEAVSAYRNGDLLPVLQHNLADVHRTWELGELVRRFVSPKDVTSKKL
jgi:hypothetical protein